MVWMAVMPFSPFLTLIIMDITVKAYSYVQPPCDKRQRLVRRVLLPIFVMIFVAFKLFELWLATQITLMTLASMLCTACGLVSCLGWLLHFLNHRCKPEHDEDFWDEDYYVEW